MSESRRARLARTLTVLTLGFLIAAGMSGQFMFGGAL